LVALLIIFCVKFKNKYGLPKNSNISVTLALKLKTIESIVVTLEVQVFKIPSCLNALE